MKKFNQIISAIKIEYHWYVIKKLKKEEVKLNVKANKLNTKKLQHRTKAEELSLYYEDISGYREVNTARPFEQTKFSKAA